MLPGLTSSGVLRTTEPMTPTRTPLTRNTAEVFIHAGSRPVAVSTTLVARNGKFARAWCLRIRSIPKSNSWLPKLVASSPHAFSTSIAGMSSSSADAGGDAPTLSPAASSSDWPGSFAISSSNIVASCAAPPTGTAVLASSVVAAGSELTVEVVQADDVHRREVVAVVDDVAPHDALAVLRRRDAEQERRRRRQVDAADVLRHAAVDPVAAGEERRPHVRVRAQVLHVRHVAVLAEERRRRDQRAGRRRVELVRRVAEGHDVTRTGRVRHVGRAAGAVRDVAGLGLRVDAVDDLPVLRLAVVGPVVGVLEVLEGGLDPGDHGRLALLGGERGVGRGGGAHLPGGARRSPGRGRRRSGRSARRRPRSTPWPCRSSRGPGICAGVF